MGKDINSAEKGPEESDGVRHQAEGEPYRKLLFGVERFLSDLECTHEMFRVVTPILLEQDRARSIKRFPQDRT